VKRKFNDHSGVGEEGGITRTGGPGWERFLIQVMGEGHQLVTYLQTVISYTHTHLPLARLGAAPLGDGCWEIYGVCMAN
jgi:hypothetical protein